MKQSLIILLFLFLYIQPGNALPANDTDTLSLSLSNVVDLAIQQSASVKYAQNTNVNYYWRWKT